MTTLRALSTAFGLVMAAAAALRTDDLGLAVVAAAVIAVLAAVQFRWAATPAVLCCVTVLTMSDASAVQCALAGFAATCFLVLGSEVLPVPTVVAVLAATAVGLAATAVPVTLPWAPLAAPPVVLVAFVVTVHTLRRRVRAAASRPPRSPRENEV